MRSFRKWFIICMILFVSCGVVSVTIQVIKDLLEGATPFGHTEFSEFFACGGTESTTDRYPKPVTVFPSSVQAIYVCGYLEANGVVDLEFLLVYEGDPVSWFAREEYRTGYVLEQIPQSQRQPGHYRVEVHMGRAELATTEFDIVDE